VTWAALTRAPVQTQRRRDAAHVACGCPQTTACYLGRYPRASPRAALFISTKAVAFDAEKMLRADRDTPKVDLDPRRFRSGWRMRALIGKPGFRDPGFLFVE